MSIPEETTVSRAAGVVGFFTFLSRILGMIRDMVLAAFFGAGMAADAFFVAFRIPNLLRRLFAEGSLTIAFIPVFTQYLTNKSKAEAFDLARTVLTVLTFLLVILTLLGILFSPWIVRVQAFGFGGSNVKYELTVLLTRIMFPYILLISLVAFFMGVLNSLRHFSAPAAAPLFLNAGIIGAAYFISPHLQEPIIGVAIGVIIGGILQVGLQVPWVMAKGVNLFPKWNPANPGVRRIGILMLPAIFGSAVYQFNQFMGTLLASFLEEGSVSWLYYADRLVQFPLGVFAIAISTAALPSLSSQAAEKELERFEATLAHALRLVFFITLPATAGLIVLGRPIISILFERGAFDARATVMTDLALVCYALGLWAFSGIRVVVAAYYALQDTKTPVKVAVLSVMVNIMFSLFLAFMTPLRHGGLALALSIASAVQFFLLVILLQRKISMKNLKLVMVPAAKHVIAATIMGLCVYLLHSGWLTVQREMGAWRMIWELMCLIGIGMFIYFGVARILGCEEFKAIRDMIRPFGRRIRRRQATGGD